MVGVARGGPMQAILSAADYFNFVFAGYNPNFYFLILLFGPCIVL